VHTCILINPNAGSANAAEAVRSQAASSDGVVCRTSPDPSTVDRLVEQAVHDGAERIVAAGGDGTVNSVLNAIRRRHVDVQLGLVPLGTGNDLARTLAIPNALESALAVATRGSARLIDLYVVRWAGSSRFGINVAAGGFSGQVDEALSDDLKAAWGPMAYLVGAAQVIPNLEKYTTHISVDGGARRRIQALNIVVANGRTAAGGRPVAPPANPCDGLLDVVIVKQGKASELAKVATQLVTGNYLESPLVTHQRVRHIAVASEPGMWFNVDGELITNEPLSIEVMPRAQSMIVGPTFQPSPAR
jgi:diacylglycerol kinase (ATP)